MAPAFPKEIKNKKAAFEYNLLQPFEAGIVLTGTEVKSIREGNANLKDSYCYFKGEELYVKNLFIAEYKFGTIHNHETRRDRKLLLKRQELKKLKRKTSEKGLTIIPFKIYFSERGFIKLELYLASGKRAYDKRHSIKDRDIKRDLDRQKNM